MPQALAELPMDTFFGGIEVTWVKDAAERAAVKRAIDTARIQVGYGAQPVVLIGKLDPNSLEETERKKAVEELKVRVDEARELGSQATRFPFGEGPGGQGSCGSLEGAGEVN